MSEELHSDPHEHEHHHHGHGTPDTPQKMEALLRHMHMHNESHTGELKDLRDKLAAAGNHRAADKLTEALKSYEEGNEKLHEALSMIHVPV